MGAPLTTRRRYKFDPREHRRQPPSPMTAPTPPRITLVVAQFPTHRRLRINHLAGQRRQRGLLAPWEIIGQGQVQP